MRIIHPILALLAVAAICGCENSAPSRLPWETKVPVTKPQAAPIVVPAQAAPARDTITEADLIGPASQPALKPAVTVDDLPGATNIQVAEPSATQPAAGATVPDIGPIDRLIAEAATQPANQPVPPPLPAATSQPPAAQPVVLAPQPAVAAAVQAARNPDAPTVKAIPASGPAAPAATDSFSDFNISIDSPAEKPAPETQPTSAPRISEDEPQAISNKPEMVAASVLQVNDRFITIEDVLHGARIRIAQLPRGIAQDTFRDQARTIIQDEIRDTVNESLVYEEAARRQSDQEKEQIDKELEETLKDLVAAAGGSKSKLEQEMIEEGTTLVKALEEQRRRLVSQQFLHAKFTPAIHVNRRMLWEFYQANQAMFSTPKKVQMQIVSVGYRDLLGDDDATPGQLRAVKDKARQRIDAAAAALKAGKSFADVARQYSTDARKDDGGLWPLMPAGSFRLAKVEDAAFNLPQGAASGVIEDEGGLYIVRAAQVQPGSVLEFEQAQDKIEDALRRQQYRKLSEEYYQKLVKAAIIVQSDDFLDRCVNKAVKRYWQR